MHNNANTEKSYLFLNTTPLHFLGLSHYIKNLNFLCAPDFSSEWLKNIETQKKIRESNANYTASILFDEAIENELLALNTPLCFPPTALREKIENKPECSRLAEIAGVPPVPYVAAPVPNYATLRQHADEASLGQELVVQTPNGNSGNSTFFISNQSDYDRHAKKIEAAPECRIMYRLNQPHSLCIEAVITNNGIIVGLPANDLVGHKELTPNEGGWCGNEIGLTLFAPSLVEKIREGTRKIGEAIQQRYPEYKGYFGVDWLIEKGTERLYPGEINARCTGMMPLSNISTQQAGIPPLFLFHLAAQGHINLDINIDEYHHRLCHSSQDNIWSLLIIKYLDDIPSIVKNAPKEGLITLKNNILRSNKSEFNIHNIKDFQAYWIPEVHHNQQVYKGDILGRLLLKSQVKEPNTNQLTDYAKTWIKQLRQQHDFLSRAFS